MTAVTSSYSPPSAGLHATNLCERLPACFPSRRIYRVEIVDVFRSLQYWMNRRRSYCKPAAERQGVSTTTIPWTVPPRWLDERCMS